MNTYNGVTKQWQQFWVGQGGDLSEFSGVYKDNAMRFTGKTSLPDGTLILRRLTFFNLEPGHVRQFSEVSNDGGKTWSVGYDFNYVRKKDAAQSH